MGVGWKQGGVRVWAGWRQCGGKDCGMVAMWWREPEAV